MLTRRRLYEYGAIKLHIWRYKTAWISNIIHWATGIYDKTKVQVELNRIKKPIPWNDFPIWIHRTLIAKKLKNNNTATIKTN